MIIQKSRFYVGLILASLFLICFFSNCTQTQKGDEVKQAADLIREYALKSNPALKGKKLRVSMTIDGGLNEVCACIKVCDANGNNCTACTCSPANCGSCE